MDDVLYTAKETAKLLKSNVDYVHKLRKSGLLKFIKIGTFKVRRQALNKFLEDYEGKDISDPFNVKELENGGEIKFPKRYKTQMKQLFKQLRERENKEDVIE